VNANAGREVAESLEGSACISERLWRTGVIQLCLLSEFFVADTILVTLTLRFSGEKVEPLLVECDEVLRELLTLELILDQILSSVGLRTKQKSGKECLPSSTRRCLPIHAKPARASRLTQRQNSITDTLGVTYGGCEYRSCSHSFPGLETIVRQKL